MVLLSACSRRAIATAHNTSDGLQKNVKLLDSIAEESGKGSGL
jgi:hypothetical protein